MIPGLERGAKAGEPVALHLRKVLIVDEAAPVRRKLLEILHRAGVAASDVVLVEGADAALEAFALEHPTLVFCELVGEPAAGLEMVREMLRMDPQAKVVLVTAEDPASHVVRQAVRAGIFGIIRKPLRYDAIRVTLAEIEAEEGGIERYR